MDSFHMQQTGGGTTSCPDAGRSGRRSGGAAPNQSPKLSRGTSSGVITSVLWQIYTSKKKGSWRTTPQIERRMK